MVEPQLCVFYYSSHFLEKANKLSRISPDAHSIAHPNITCCSDSHTSAAILGSCYRIYRTIPSGEHMIGAKPPAPSEPWLVLDQ